MTPMAEYKSDDSALVGTLACVSHIKGSYYRDRLCRKINGENPEETLAKMKIPPLDEDASQRVTHVLLRHFHVMMKLTMLSV